MYMKMDENGKSTVLCFLQQNTQIEFYTSDFIAFKFVRFVMQTDTSFCTVKCITVARFIEGKSYIIIVTQ